MWHLVIVSHALTRSHRDVLKKEPAVTVFRRPDTVESAWSAGHGVLTDAASSLKRQPVKNPQGGGHQPAPEVVLQAMGFGLGWALPT